MDHLEPSGNLSRFVVDCIEESGGYGYNDGVNTILRRETLLKYNSSIFTIPLIQVPTHFVTLSVFCAE